MLKVTPQHTHTGLFVDDLIKLILPHPPPTQTWKGQTPSCPLFPSPQCISPSSMNNHSYSAFHSLPWTIARDQDRACRPKANGFVHEGVWNKDSGHSPMFTTNFSRTSQEGILHKFLTFSLGSLHFFDGSGVHFLRGVSIFGDNHWNESIIWAKKLLSST